MGPRGNSNRLQPGCILGQACWQGQEGGGKDDGHHTRSVHLQQGREVTLGA